MPIDEALKDSILVKCARRCAICRRFRPTWLQIHHIVPQSEGGGDEESNLIPICIACHTDVHTSVPFTRRFTPNELRMHREELYRMVREGVLPASPERGDIARVVVSRAMLVDNSVTLDELAARMLLVTARSRTGELYMTPTNVGLIFKTESEVLLGGEQTPRDEAAHRHALEVLLDNDLMEMRTDKIAQVTHRGFAVADDIEASNAS